MLTELNFESARLFFDLDAAPGKRIVNGVIERFLVAKYADGFQGCGKVGALVAKHRSECADLRTAHGRCLVGAKALVKAPATNRLADGEHLRGSLRIGDGGKHAVVRT